MQLTHLDYLLHSNYVRIHYMSCNGQAQVVRMFGTIVTVPEIEHFDRVDFHVVKTE